MLQIILTIILYLIMVVPVGTYVYHIAAGKHTFADPVFDRVDGVIFKISGVDPASGMNWKRYAAALVGTNAVMILLGYIVLRIQSIPLFNPNGIGGMEESLSFNTIISFMTNTNLQHYSGESGLSYLSQMLVIIFMMFVSAATGYAACIAFIRGLAGKSKDNVGNFFVDLVRIITRVLLPFSIVGGLLLVWQGVPQNFSGNVVVDTIEETKQVIAMGPVAALEIIKHLGTNGGGFLGANSSTPIENPTILSNLIELYSMMLLPGACVITFGKMVRDRKKLKEQPEKTVHTLDIQHVIRDILKLNIDYMLHEDYGHYKYTEHYYLGDVFVYTSQDEEKGTLLELKGKGCRQFESYLLAQGRSWYDFLMDALIEGGVMKRLDLAINDRAGILDIPDLTAKCNREECVSLFRSFKSYASGELVKHNEQDKAGMGHTLYIGSLKSEVYFCCYEKNYEQYAKLGIPIEEAPIKNRFEIRLKDERAYYAVRELLTHYDAEQTAFSIINHYIRFVDREPEKRKTDWKLNDRWAWFIGKDRPPVKLTTDPEPYTLERTLGWISRQVAPTLKMLKKIDAGNSTSYLKEIEDNAKLTEKHLQIIKQQTADTEELITE